VPSPTLKAALLVSVMAPEPGELSSTPVKAPIGLTLAVTCVTPTKPTPPIAALSVLSA
jgi:hypothetical protein